MTSIVRYEPFGLVNTRPTFDRFFDRLFDDALGWTREVAPATLRVAANLYETNEAYYVELPLPGVKPDDVEVTVQENVLTISAKRNWQAPEQAKAIWQGFTPGEWKQSFTLPGEVNPDKVEAAMEYGVLRLQLPKAEHVRPRTIRVNAMNGSAPQAIEAHVTTDTPKAESSKAKSNK